MRRLHLHAPAVAPPRRGRRPIRRGTTSRSRLPPPLCLSGSSLYSYAATVSITTAATTATAILLRAQLDPLAPFFLSNNEKLEIIAAHVSSLLPTIANANTAVATATGAEAGEKAINACSGVPHGGRDSCSRSSSCSSYSSFAVKPQRRRDLLTIPLPAAAAAAVHDFALAAAGSFAAAVFFAAAIAAAAAATFFFAGAVHAAATTTNTTTTTTTTTATVHPRSNQLGRRQWFGKAQRRRC